MLADLVELAIRSNLSAAGVAWDRLRQGHGAALKADFESMKLAAEISGLALEQFCVTKLSDAMLLREFVSALHAQGILVEKATIDWSNDLPPDIGSFFARTQAFRCLIRVNGFDKGSGVLLAPNTVLTAWHVIAVNRPANPQEPEPTIEVEIGGSRRIGASVNAEACSTCCDLEYDQKLPQSDAEVEGRDDFALLRLSEPAGIHLQFAWLPPQPYELRSGAMVLLVHYPEGESRGPTLGMLRRWKGLSARWRYQTDSAPGSSGGGCFNMAYHLIGIHQGTTGNGDGRLVPSLRFLSVVKSEIDKDLAPESIWSLDDTLSGDLVVGREDFFIAFSAAARSDPPNLKGLWIKRTNPEKDVTGLPFSFAMLERMVARNPKIRLVRISFDAVFDDLADEIARRVRISGIPVDDVAPQSGVAAAHTEPEAMITDRSRRLANAVDAAARAAGVQLFVFFDHPVIAFGDTLRWALAGFLDQALRLGNLRLVVAGYEAIQLPGQQFANPQEAAASSGPGLMVEYLTGFQRFDVENLIRRAGEALGHSIGPELIEAWTDQALNGLENVTGRYEWWNGATVSLRLKELLATLTKEAAS